MQKYGIKRDKALATKGWVAKEGLSVWEAERVMDVELFLEGHVKWEADSPYCLMMLYEMFCHASDQGQKEVEQTVCWGHRQELPKLDPVADLSTVQLVGPHTSKKEIQSLYIEVYKQCRPKCTSNGSGPGGRDRAAQLPPSGVSPSWGHTPGVGTTRYMDPGGRKGGATRHSPRAVWPPTSNITLPKGTQSLVWRQWLLKTLTWRSHWNWGWRLPVSSEGQLRAQKKRKKHPLLNPSEGAL